MTQEKLKILMFEKQMGSNFLVFLLDELLQQLTDKQSCHSINFVVLQGLSSCGSDVFHG